MPRWFLSWVTLVQNANLTFPAISFGQVLRGKRSPRGLALQERLLLLRLRSFCTSAVSSVV